MSFFEQSFPFRMYNNTQSNSEHMFRSANINNYDDDNPSSQPMSFGSSPTDSNEQANNCNNLSSQRRNLEFCSISEIPPKYRHLFASYPCFNAVQSKVMNDVLYSDVSVVVSAPTGSGKTVIFELAIIRLLTKLEEAMYAEDFKIVYMAPVKALCSERYADWKNKFCGLGLRCLEITGDTDDFELSSLSTYQLLLTTPEKWDSLTRKWKDNIRMVKVVKLFLIDEVHLLNEEIRGPTLEVVVSRMKTIQQVISVSRKQKQAERTNSEEGDNPHSEIRFIAVSATIPNIEDLAQWLGKSEDNPAKHFKISEDMRPVKLKKVVLGYSCPVAISQFKFEISLSYKLRDIMFKHSEGKPTLIFCSTRKGVEQTCSTLVKQITFNFTVEQKQKLGDYGLKMSESKLKDHVLSGVGYHHAGMLKEDRQAMEYLFREGLLPVLVTTSTLAMGVNLPAHLVIIKATQQYISGAYQEYSETQILQMIGRAGRPQFDTSAVAVIMTKQSQRNHYENLISGKDPIESNLHRHLAEHLNSEVVLHTIADIGYAMEWIRSTFLYVRALKNPTHYGISAKCNKKSIESNLQEMCKRELNALATAKLLTLDMMDVKPTSDGVLMARYYLKLGTMKVFGKVKGNESLEDVVHIIASCQEFSGIQLRVSEKKHLNQLNKASDRKCIRFPLPTKITTREMKVNCLIQAMLGSLTIFDPSLKQDLLQISWIGRRVANALVQYLRQRSHYQALLNSVTLAKCFFCKMWEDSPYVSRQLKGIGQALSALLMSSNKTSFQSIAESNPRDLESILNRPPPMGDNLIYAVIHLPKYEMNVEYVKEGSANKLAIAVTISNRDLVQQHNTAGSNHWLILLVGDSENNCLYSDRFRDDRLMRDDSSCWKVNIKDSSTKEVFVNLISEQWIGLDVHCSMTIQQPRQTPLIVKNALERFLEGKTVKCESTKTQTSQNKQEKTPKNIVDHIRDISEKRLGISSANTIKKFAFNPKSKLTSTVQTQVNRPSRNAGTSNSSQLVSSATINDTSNKGVKSIDSFFESLNKSFGERTQEDSLGQTNTLIHDIDKNKQQISLQNNQIHSAVASRELCNTKEESDESLTTENIENPLGNLWELSNAGEEMDNTETSKENNSVKPEDIDIEDADTIPYDSEISSHFPTDDSTDSLKTTDSLVSFKNIFHKEAVPKTKGCRKNNVLDGNESDLINSRCSTRITGDNGMKEVCEQDIANIEIRASETKPDRLSTQDYAPIEDINTDVTEETDLIQMAGKQDITSKYKQGTNCVKYENAKKDVKNKASTENILTATSKNIPSFDYNDIEIIDLTDDSSFPLKIDQDSISRVEEIENHQMSESLHHGYSSNMGTKAENSNRVQINSVNHEDQSSKVSGLLRTLPNHYYPIFNKYPQTHNNPESQCVSKDLPVLVNNPLPSSNFHNNFRPSQTVTNEILEDPSKNTCYLEDHYSQDITRDRTEKTIVPKLSKNTYNSQIECQEAYIHSTTDKAKVSKAHENTLYLKDQFSKKVIQDTTKKTTVLKPSENTTYFQDQYSEEAVQCTTNKIVQKSEKTCSLQKQFSEEVIQDTTKKAKVLKPCEKTTYFQDQYSEEAVQRTTNKIVQKSEKTCSLQEQLLEEVVQDTADKITVPYLNKKTSYCQDQLTKEVVENTVKKSTISNEKTAEIAKSRPNFDLVNFDDLLAVIVSSNSGKKLNILPKEPPAKKYQTKSNPKLAVIAPSYKISHTTTENISHKPKVDREQEFQKWFRSSSLRSGVRSNRDREKQTRQEANQCAEHLLWPSYEAHLDSNNMQPSSSNGNNVFSKWKRNANAYKDQPQMLEYQSGRKNNIEDLFITRSNKTNESQETQDSLLSQRYHQDKTEGKYPHCLFTKTTVPVNSVPVSKARTQAIKTFDHQSSHKERKLERNVPKVPLLMNKKASVSQEPNTRSLGTFAHKDFFQPIEKLDFSKEPLANRENLSSVRESRSQGLRPFEYPSFSQPVGKMERFDDPYHITQTDNYINRSYDCKKHTVNGFIFNNDESERLYTGPNKSFTMHSQTQHMTDLESSSRSYNQAHKVVFQKPTHPIKQEIPTFRSQWAKFDTSPTNSDNDEPPLVRASNMNDSENFYHGNFSTNNTDCQKETFSDIFNDNDYNDSYNINDKQYNVSQDTAENADNEYSFFNVSQSSETSNDSQHSYNVPLSNHDSGYGGNSFPAHKRKLEGTVRCNSQTGECAYSPFDRMSDYCTQNHTGQIRVSDMRGSLHPPQGTYSPPMKRKYYG